MKNLIPARVKEALKSFRTKPRYPKFLMESKTVLNGLVAYNKYGGYFTPVSSQLRPAVQKILNGDIYEPDTIKFIRDNCGDGDIVHAGTFFGDFLPGISGSLSAGAKIWAFEPQLESFRCAQITILINDLKNVAFFNCGLGEMQTNSQMLIEAEDGLPLGGASQIVKGNLKNEKTIDVKIVRIDDIIPKNRAVSIIQLDVEGYEKEALMGGLNTIKRCKPILILEDNNKIIETNWFAEYICSIGYEVNRKIHGNTLLTINTLHHIV